MSDSLDARLALALEQQLTAAPPLQSSLSDEEFVALLAERRELMNAHRALQSTSRHDFERSPKRSAADRDNLRELVQRQLDGWQATGEARR